MLIIFDFLTVAPGPPKSVIQVLVTSDLVELEVEPPLDNGGVEVIGYRVEYEEKILTFALGKGRSGHKGQNSDLTNDFHGAAVLFPKTSTGGQFE